MTINSAIMLEATRQRHLDGTHGVANTERPTSARDGSTANRRLAYRTRLAMVTAVVVGTLMWAAFVTGLAGLTPAKADAAPGTELAATAYQPQTASVTMTRPTRTVEVTPKGHVISTPKGHVISTPKGHVISTPNGHYVSTPDNGNARSTPDSGNARSTPNSGNARSTPDHGSWNSTPNGNWR